VYIKPTSKPVYWCKTPKHFLLHEQSASKQLDRCAPPPILLMFPIGAVRKASLDTHAICSTGGKKVPLPLCLIYHTSCPINTHTHTHRHTGRQLALHTLQTNGKTNTHGGLQLTCILQHLFMCIKKSHAHTHTHTRSCIIHARTLAHL